MVHSDGIWNDLKTRTINGAFCRYLIKHFDLQRNIWKQWIKMVHSATIWYDVSTWREKIESNESYWCIMSLFYTTFWRTGKNWKQWIQIVHSAAILFDILTCRENVESKELNAFWDLWSTTFMEPRVLNFHFFKNEVCRPWPTVPIGATPVDAMHVLGVMFVSISSCLVIIVVSLNWNFLFIYSEQFTGVKMFTLSWGRCIQ